MSGVDRVGGHALLKSPRHKTREFTFALPNLNVDDDKYDMLSTLPPPQI